MISEGYKFKKPENVTDKKDMNDAENISERKTALWAEFKVLEYLNEETRAIVEGNIATRKQKIDELVGACNLDANKVFQEIFDVPATHAEMIVKPFGLYFTGDEKAFKGAYPTFSSFLHNGLMVSHADDMLIRREDFIGMVGFGNIYASAHELDHMFNSMLPMQEIFLEYKEIKTDPQRGKDEKTIYEVKMKQYKLWANSFLKDEILARIDDGKILEAEEQEPRDVYSSGAKIFTTYEPNSLYEFVSPFKSDVKEFGIEPASREEYEQFQVMYDKIVDPIRNQWLERYNQNIRAIKKAITGGIEKAKVKAIIISNPFENIAIELEKEPHPQLEKNINSVELASVIENFLQESSQYDVDCLDLKDDIAKVVSIWFEENKNELVENFKDLLPQKFPPKQKLLEIMRPILTLDRIHINKDIGLEFRRTKIIDNWVGEIYHRLLKDIFKKEIKEEGDFL